MGHAAPPPSEADIKKVHEYNERLCQFLANLPGDWSHGEMRDEQDDWAEYPVWGFTCMHDTLPAREISIIWGLPAHSENCKCIEASKPVMSISVLDRDDNVFVPDCAQIRIENPADFSVLKGIVGVAIILFDKTGVL